MPARPITFRFVALFEDLGRDLGGRADGEAVIIADDRGELVLVLAEIGLEIDLDAAILEDLDGGGRQSVGNENAGRSWVNSFAGVMAGLDRRRSSLPGDSGSMSAKSSVLATSAGMNGERLKPPSRAPPFLREGPVEPGRQRFEIGGSTVAPHQMRRPGGASR